MLAYGTLLVFEHLIVEPYHIPSVMVGYIGCPFALQYTSMVINIAIQHIELKMGTTQNDATNMMADVRCCRDAVVRGWKSVDYRGPRWA